MTGQDVYEAALALIDEIGDDGTIDEDTTASYEGKAPRLLDMIQRELAIAENVTATQITALTSVLVVSDDTALRVMPYGLAAKFALQDKDLDLYGELIREYDKLKRTIRSDEADITDEYDVLQGMQY
jgi:hypothetical protein